MQDVFLPMVTPPTTLHLFHALELIKSNRDSVRKAREAYLQQPYHGSQLKVVNLVSRPLPRWTKARRLWVPDWTGVNWGFRWPVSHDHIASSSVLPIESNWLCSRFYFLGGIYFHSFMMKWCEVYVKRVRTSY